MKALTLLPLAELVAVHSATNIYDEVDLLRQKSIDAITSMHVAEAFAAANVLQMPKVLNDEVTLYVENKSRNRVRGQDYRTVKWDTMLWLITLTFVAEHGTVSTSQLSELLKSWASNIDNCIDPSLIQSSSWQLAERYIATLVSIGWLEMHSVQKPYKDSNGKTMLLTVVPLTAPIKDAIEAHKDKLVSRVTMKCQPLKHKPEEWTSNYDGVAPNAGLRLIKGQSSKHVSKRVLRAVNRVQSTAFNVHRDMLALCNVVLSNEEYFRHLWKHTQDEWDSIRLRWMQFSTLKTDTEYYFPVTCDYRGRMYYRGGLVHPQSEDFCKAGFIFNRALPLQDSGFYALCNAFANTIKCKGAVNEKVKYVETLLQPNEEGVSWLEWLCSDFMNICKQFPDADHCQAWVTGTEILDAWQWKKVHGTTATFCSRLPVHQDGCCNGLQHQAALTHDRITAEATNLTKQSFRTRPSDVYTQVADALQLPQLQGNRDGVKKPVMITGYGAGEFTVSTKVQETCTKLGIKFENKLVTDIMSAMATKVPALLQCTAAIQDMATRAIHEQGVYSFEWETLDGLVIRQSYEDNEEAILRGGSFSCHLGNTGILDVSKMVTALSPNFTHGVDATHLRYVCTETRWDLITVHDSIASHACNYFATNKIIRSTFSKVHQYPWMRVLAEALQVTEPVFLGDYSAEEAKFAVNMFG
jgi:hypothetical protein